MALDALGYAVSRIEERDADIYVGDGQFDNDDLLYSMGAVRDVTVSGEARTTTPDSHGRTYQKGVNLTVQWIVMQTGYSVEVAEIPDLILVNRLMVKVTDTIVDFDEGIDLPATQANASTAAHAASGIEFENARITFGFDFDFNGEDNIFTITLTARLSLEQVKQLGNSTVVIGNA